MEKWFPRLYDRVMDPLEKMKLKKIRQALIDKATGRVLEVGAGTGINFPYYQRAIQVDAIEPNPMMRDRSLNRKTNVPIHIYVVGAEKLPFADNTFDSVVATLVFCTIPNPDKALKEIRRVSKPGAKLLLLEHIRMDKQWLGKTQDLLTPIWKKVCDGCHLNRNTVELVENAGFKINKRNYFYSKLFVTMECLNGK